MADLSAPLETHMIPSGIAIAVLAPFCLILNLAPLIWHIRARNTAAIFLVSWCLLLNLITMINVLIWPYIPSVNSIWLGEGFCDVQVKLLVARSTGLPAAALCLVRALAKVMDTSTTSLGLTEGQKKRALLVDLAWCAGLPVLTMVFHYLVQYNRYFVFGVSGCQPSIVMNWTAFFLVWLPPLLLSLAAAYYAVLILIRLRRYRASFSTLLASSRTTKSRFLRLFTIALLLILGTLPAQLYILIINPPYTSNPNSFATIHDPAMWDTILVGESKIFYDRWIGIACGIAVFGLFGCGRDAVGMYKQALVRCGMARCFPWLLTTTPAASQASSRAQHCSNSSGSASPSPQKSHFVTIDMHPTPPQKPLAVFLGRFNRSRHTSFELPVFHRRQASDEGVLVSKEVKRESCTI